MGVGPPVGLPLEAERCRNVSHVLSDSVIVCGHTM